MKVQKLFRSLCGYAVGFEFQGAKFLYFDRYWWIRGKEGWTHATGAKHVYDPYYTNANITEYEVIDLANEHFIVPTYE